MHSSLCDQKNRGFIGTVENLFQVCRVIRVNFRDGVSSKRERGNTAEEDLNIAGYVLYIITAGPLRDGPRNLSDVIVRLLHNEWKYTEGLAIDWLLEGVGSK